MRNTKEGLQQIKSGFNYLKSDIGGFLVSRNCPVRCPKLQKSIARAIVKKKILKLTPEMMKERVRILFSSQKQANLMHHFLIQKVGTIKKGLGVNIWDVQQLNSIIEYSIAAN